MRLNNSRTLRWTIGIGGANDGRVRRLSYGDFVRHRRGGPTRQEGNERQHSQQPHQYFDRQW